MIRRLAHILSMIMVALLLVWGGLELRACVWDWTMPIRFNGDIDNGFQWGKFARHVGYWNVYDELGAPSRERADHGRTIDYGPLRLGVMSAWVRWLTPRYPTLDHRQPTAAFHAPLLWFNTGIEAAVAVATFVLVLLVLPRSTWSAWIALVGAALAWFDPLILFNAHAWPQWDVWPMPFYLFAVCCALRRRWLLGGLIIGLGSMLKGQVLIVAWTLPLWALFVGDWRGAIRFCIGGATSVLLIGGVWELSTYLPGMNGYDQFVKRHPGAAVRHVDWPAVAWVLLWISAALALPRRFSPTLLCLAIAGALGSTYFLFNANGYWFRSGIVVGTWHFKSALFVGTTSNLPAILQERYHWNDPAAELFTLKLFGLPLTVTLRMLLLAVYFVASLWCVAWASIHDRRRDPKVLLAIFMPWLLFYCLPAQIHERYLLFFSACVGALVVCGPAWVLLGMIVTVIGLAITMQGSLVSVGIPSRPPGDPHHTVWTVLQYLINGTHPGIAWMLLLIAVIGVYSVCRRTAAPCVEALE